ncbi:MAG: 23S rRNA (adenine(2503)-C(2))-methyltransferase RlmN [Candidatus Melainabacteria bacterium HGW-Melainabacteria-1]|nr:MAG: 23S rRNA (adenine(2503)-C(2))-methyltransferase RlmN [Candidatus Melainabacteria bacterium HGW-Melainabacteria-1]
MKQTTTESRPVLTGLKRGELESLVAQLGEKPFRAKQLEKWIFDKAVRAIDEMSDLSKAFREKLTAETVLSPHQVIETVSSRDGTTKFLIRLADGQSVECVTIVQDRHLTACLSSQVGCNVGCPFCATGLSGFRRNLSVAEIVDQFLIMQHAIRQGALKAFSDHDHLSNIVFMGMGEPLLNYEPLMGAIEILNRQAGIGLRRITISTSGIIPGIEKLMQEARDYNLAISLHSAKPEVRDTLVPINRKYKVDQLLELAGRYAEHTGRRITFEYTMLAGHNASAEDAKALATALRGIHCHINLIAYNPVDSPYQAPPRAEIEAFQNILVKAGYPVTIRHNHGQDDMAACGQLRLYSDEQLLKMVEA